MASAEQIQATTLLDSLPDGIFLIDPDWRIVFANPVAERLLRFDRGAVLGKRIGIDLPEPPAERLAIYREVMRSREPRRMGGVRMEVPLLGERVFDAEVHPAPDGGIALVFRDVTARAEAEQRTRARAEEAEALRDIGRDLLSRVEPDRVLERIAFHTRSLLGASYAAVALVEPSGETRWPVVVGNESDAWRTAVFPVGTGIAGRVISQDAPVVMEGFPENPEFDHEEFRAHASEGMRSALGVPLHTPGREPIGALIAGWRTPHQVTEHETETTIALAQTASLALANARLFEEMDEARQNAEAANRAKSQFLATMSHELRTPINAVVGYAELLEMGVGGGLTAQQRRYLERVKASSQHLLGLINEVLDLAKVEAGQLRVVEERGSLRSTLAEALALVLPQAEAKGVSVPEDPGCAPEVAYSADPDRVRQILINLLGNAVKFTPPGGSVRVRCQVDSRRVALEVEDTGIGIAATELERIFEPFVEGDATSTREYEGTGLGLTISRRLARLMGGDLVARSRPGRGSRFTLSLPAAAPGAPPPVEPAEVDHSDELVARATGRFRSGLAVPQARELDQPRLEDHYATFFTDVGLFLVALDEGGGRAPLLRDGANIQRLISHQHGQQRARVGWTETALQREYGMVREEIEAILREGTAEDGDRAAAWEVVGRLLDQAEQISLRGFAVAQLARR